MLYQSAISQEHCSGIVSCGDHRACNTSIKTPNWKTRLKWVKFVKGTKSVESRLRIVERI